MAMNRQTKRMLQRQGELGPDGEPQRPRDRQRPAPKPARERTSPRQYTREVRGELRKVAWPTRDEVARYSVIVLIALTILTLYIFGVDFVASKAIFWLFNS